MSERPTHDLSDDSKAGGRGTLTAKGVGGAFLFVLLIIVLRGGKKLLRENVEGNQVQGQVAQPQEKRVGAANAQDVLTEWMEKENNLQEILAAGREHGLTDNELDAVLKDLWKQKNGDAKVPWRHKVGDMDWRVNVDWNVGEAKQAIEARAAELKGTRNVAPEPSGEAVSSPH